MKSIKRFFCNHEFTAVNSFTIEKLIKGEWVIEEDRVILYCPKCDFEKEENFDEWEVSLKTEIGKIKAKEEYLASINEISEEEVYYID